MAAIDAYAAISTAMDFVGEMPCAGGQVTIGFGVNMHAMDQIEIRHADLTLTFVATLNDAQRRAAVVEAIRLWAASVPPLANGDTFHLIRVFLPDFTAFTV